MDVWARDRDLKISKYDLKTETEHTYERCNFSFLKGIKVYHEFIRCTFVDCKFEDGFTFTDCEFIDDDVDLDQYIITIKKKE